ncbi:unnamed protein product [Boreogadus saida]
MTRNNEQCHNGNHKEGKSCAWYKCRKVDQQESPVWTGAPDCLLGSVSIPANKPEQPRAPAAVLVMDHPQPSPKTSATSRYTLD